MCIRDSLCIISFQAARCCASSYVAPLGFSLFVDTLSPILGVNFSAWRSWWTGEILEAFCLPSMHGWLQRHQGTVAGMHLAIVPSWRCSTHTGMWQGVGQASSILFMELFVGQRNNKRKVSVPLGGVRTEFEARSRWHPSPFFSSLEVELHCFTTVSYTHLTLPTKRIV